MKKSSNSNSQILDTDKTPRYLRLTQEVRRQVASGVLQPGDCLPSISTLRATHGISKSTIERAHLLLEQEGLIVREHGRGTFVADAASRRAAKSTSVIGFCTPGFTQSNFSPFWIHLMQGIEKAAHDCRAQIVLLRDDSPLGWDEVDGVLVSSGWPKIPARRIPTDLPLVSLFLPANIVGDKVQCARIEANMTVVCVDDYAAMRQATRHLLALGHRRITFLNNGANDTWIHARRLAGYHDALREAGIRPNRRWLRSLPLPGPALYFMPTGRDTMKAWLHDDWEALNCTALLAHNDEVAWGAVEALREAGLKTPDDVSVVGFDGTEAADCCTPALTTVKVPLQQMGKQSVELLWSRINGKSHPNEILIPTKLRVAGSTARV